MLNLISYIVLIIGGLNWASIGFLQYDFIAGFFGTQANIFSRIIYIVIGIAAFIIVFITIKNKGTFKIFVRKNQKKPEHDAGKDLLS